MIPKSTTDNYAQDFLSALLKGNKPACTQITQKYLDAGATIEELYESIYKESLYKIGEYWELNKISVATEHLATSITESIMNTLYENIISDKRINKKVIVTCATEETHQVGAKMVADIFEKSGWDTLFLGASTPINEIISFIKKEEPDLITISLTVYFHMHELETMINAITNSFPLLKIIIGGQAFRNGTNENLLKNPNIKLIKGLKDLEDYIKTY